MNTKIRLMTRIAFGFTSPDALIALAMLSLGGHKPVLPGRIYPTVATREPEIFHVASNAAFSADG
jgi:hypothetical protein